MEKIVDQIYVGGDADVTKAEERGYSRLACCKDGPDGHRMMLGYNSLGAPKDDNYLFASRKHWGAMNLIDHDDVDMIPEDGILEALAWAKKEYDAERTILFHCNAGVSRGPSMALMFMRTIGEMPTSFNSSVKIFRSLYPKYDPGVGMKQRAYMLWDELLTLFKKD